MKNEFKSRFAEQIQKMLSQRATMGHSIKVYQSRLACFDQFCFEHFTDESILTKEIAFAWCNNAGGNGGFQRASIIRNFARYILLTSEEAYVMPTSFFPRQKPELPFIMNDVEIKSFFDATDRYPSANNNPLLEYTVPVIFRLQYACGMRPQEVRLLRCVDFCYTDHSVYINKGKHNKDRRLPLSKDVVALCLRYNRIVESIIPLRTYFFQSPTGGAYSKDWLHDIFLKCWRISGNDSGRGFCTPYMLRYQNLN